VSTKQRVWLVREACWTLLQLIWKITSLRREQSANHPMAQFMQEEGNRRGLQERAHTSFSQVAASAYAVVEQPLRLTGVNQGRCSQVHDLHSHGSP
jgi:hypothetical protein